MKNSIYIIVTCFLLFACSAKEEPTDESTEVTMEITEAIAPKGDVNDSTIQCTGEIGIPADATVSIHSLTNGIIKSIKLLEGDRVKKGQLLATIEHMDIIKLQEEFLKSKNEYQLAKQDIDRKRTLLQQNAIPKREFEQSEATFGIKKAQYESLKKQLSILGISESQLENGEIKTGISIVSPINGFVTKVLVNTGMFVSQDTELFELMDDTHKHLHLSVFANDIARVKVGQKVLFNLAGADEPMEAEVYLIGKSIDPENKAVHVHCHLKGEGKDLIVGSSVFATIRID